MNLSVIGAGYVGLVAAACFAEMGHDVICVDNDAEKIKALQAGKIPIHEEFLEEIVKKQHRVHLDFSTSILQAVRESDAVFIAVGTPPSENGEADLSYVEAVSREIARAIKLYPERYRVIVEKSTVPVDTNQSIRRVLLREGVAPECFDVASNPEFLREGTAVHDFLYPDRIVIGCDCSAAEATLRAIYRPLTDNVQGIWGAARLLVTSTKSAELIKHASNAFLAMKISFINAIADLCEKVGANVTEVSEGIGADSRIGCLFLNPGIGYGGSCFPKDVKALRAVAHSCGYEFGLLDEVMKINDARVKKFVDKVRSYLWNLPGKRIAVLGLAFKGGTDDTRDSQAIAIIQQLIHKGCKVIGYDPAAMPKLQAVNFPIEYAANAYEAAANADAVLVLTEWKEFETLDLDRLRAAINKPIPVVIDGRNLFNPVVMEAKGFEYASIGR